MVELFGVEQAGRGWAGWVGLERLGGVGRAGWGVVGLNRWGWGSKGRNKAEKEAAKMADIIEQVGAGLGSSSLGLSRRGGHGRGGLEGWAGVLSDCVCGVGGVGRGWAGWIGRVGWDSVRLGMWGCEMGYVGLKGWGGGGRAWIGGVGWSFIRLRMWGWRGREGVGGVDWKGGVGFCEIGYVGLKGWGGGGRAWIGRVGWDSVRLGMWGWKGRVGWVGQSRWNWVR